jgi:hypothetical protein
METELRYDGDASKKLLMKGRLGAYLPMLLVKVALARVAGKVAGADAEDELEVCPRGGKGDFRVALATSVLEAQLALLDRSVPVAGVLNLRIQRNERRLYNLSMWLYSRAFFNFWLTGRTDLFLLSFSEG